MADSNPETVLRSLKKGKVEPFYLFYGPEDFWIKLAIDEAKSCLVPESVRDFNMETIYGGEVSPGEILNRARLFPFMSSRRLVIVRNTEAFNQKELQAFEPYLDDPVDSTCVIWVSGAADLKAGFYDKIRKSGRAVVFKRLSEERTYAWMQKRAKAMGLTMERDACAFLYQMAGNSLRDIFNEISKLALRYPGSYIDAEKIKELAVFSRLFNIFELVDYVARRDSENAVTVLSRLLDIQGRDSHTILGILGMLARQMRLILKAKSGLGQGKAEARKALGSLPGFVKEKCISQERFWKEEEIKEALGHIYDVDGLIRSGLGGDIALENVIFNLCPPRKP